MFYLLNFIFNFFDGKRYFKQVDTAINYAMHGAYNRLYKKYCAYYDSDKAGLLAAAVTNEIFSKKPVGERGITFFQTKTKLIKNAVSELQFDEGIKQITYFSLAIKTQVIFNAQQSGAYDKNLSIPLKKLKELSLLPENQDVPQPKKFFQMAKKYYNKSLK